MVQKNKSMTISYNRLGSHGRIGNQMFQYAGLRGIATHRGFDFIIPPETHLGETNYCLFDCFNMVGVKETSKGFLNTNQQIKDQNFSFDENLFNTCPDNVDLNGYFQSEKYFKDIENIIRKDFEFSDDIFSSCKEIIDDIGDSIFLHVRRGDYIKVQSYHPLLTEEYYKKALDKFDKNISVIVLSDDQEWCKEQDIFSSDRFFISESKLKFDKKMQMGDGSFDNSLIPFWDLCIMSMCNGGIIANSSMSWWGAWMQNDRGKIVTPNPEKWFGSMYSHYDTKDLIPDRWEIVK
jgi:hypothetical protein